MTARREKIKKIEDDDTRERDDDDVFFFLSLHRECAQCARISRTYL